MFDVIVDFIAVAGYGGILVLMFAENVFPPIPSELIMPLAGFAAARGDLDITLVIVFGVAGSIAGAMPWYYAGKMLGADRLKRLAHRRGRWLTVTPADIDRSYHWFAQHGRAAIVTGRLVPAIRTLISVPAGIAKMPMRTFIGYSTVGTFIWSGLLAAAGYVLQAQYARVADYVDPVSKAIVFLIVGGYLYRLLRQAGRK